MGAIVDRLILSLQDVKLWLQIPLNYSTSVLIFSVLSAEENMDYWIATTERRTVNSGATPTTASIAALFVAKLTTNTLPGQSGAPIDLGNGKFSVPFDVSGGPIGVVVGPLMDVVPEIPTADDAVLGSLIVMAKQMADEYCNNPFTDADGNNEPIPDAVKTGVLQLIDWLYADYKASAAASSGSAGPSGPIKSRKVGDVQINYATPGEVRAALGARGAISDLPSFAVNILAMYRLMPGYESAREPRPKPFGLAQMNDNVGFIPGDDWPEGES